MVQVHLGPLSFLDIGRMGGKITPLSFGAVAQLGERQLCKLDVVGSNPISSTDGTSAFFENCIRRVEFNFC